MNFKNCMQFRTFTLRTLRYKRRLHHTFSIRAELELGSLYAHVHITHCTLSGGCENATKGDCHIGLSFSRITRNVCGQINQSRCLAATTCIQLWIIPRAVRTSMSLKASGRICGRSCMLPLHVALRSARISLRVCMAPCIR